MSHCFSVGDMKNKRRHPVAQDAPGEGTKIRAVYDFLMTHKGLPVRLPLSHLLGGPYRGSIILARLRDSYGLDIRFLARHARRGSRGGEEPATYILAGEWFGRVYIDYVAERIEAAHKNQSIDRGAT